VDDFLWIDFTLRKIDNHALSSDEVEFAWRNRSDLKRRKHPQHGEYMESLGECPSGRVIRIIWRYNGAAEGRQVFVITAY
jgi:hypothetical protein